MEEDMSEPLPPYMERLRMVMRGQRPLSTAMPSSSKNRWRGLVILIIIVLVILAASIGASINKN